MTKIKKFKWGMKIAALALSSSVLFSTFETASAATYTVKSGDSLWKIANQHGVSYQTLMSWNNLSSSNIFVGQKLNLNTTLPSTPNTPTNLVQIAKQQLGVKYAFGGTKPSTGFDCSGYITYVYNNAGISTPRKTAAGFYNSAKKVSTPKVGDLVFFANTYKPGISHAGIYIGNNQMINASNSGVTIANINSTYWKQYFVGYGRL
ncbi:NlpC/P60 family protein [Lysinibacillus sphaericus]|uniref:LytF n=1 Tax=Lysinibacillus sphaericus OT4b.31 TaxID=1285586 RepID=R7ZEH2_LYSSH|nr:NlpC/P60 family protein [Lysinibacillus sphaericus]EON72525.1 LytF [Lysinibacillus sphaericus OT4b.31]